MAAKKTLYKTQDVHIPIKHLFRAKRINFVKDAFRLQALILKNLQLLYLSIFELLARYKIAIDEDDDATAARAAEHVALLLCNFFVSSNKGLLISVNLKFASHHVLVLL